MRLLTLGASAFLVALGVLAAGCKGYEAKPLVPEEVLRGLQAVRLEALRVNPDVALGREEAVIVALVNNPDMRAFRRERGVAEGELVQAGLLDNPSLEFRGLTVIPLGREAIDFLPRWTPPRPGERAKKRSRARARVNEVSAQIVAREWRLAADTRRAFLDVLAAEERLKIAELATGIREKISTFVKEKRELGDASLVDVNLAELERVAAVRDRLVALQERTRARLELARLLGLPPATELPLRGDPLEFRRGDWELDRLEARMLEKRPELEAARHAYKQVEKSLDLAYLYRYPWLYFGPGFEREAFDVGSANRWGITLGIINIPIANQNQGQIRIQKARREQLHERFVAAVHQARAEVAEALRQVRAQAALVTLTEREVLPAVEDAQRLTEAGFSVREFDLVRLLATQDRVLQMRRQYLSAVVDHAKALVELERATGERADEWR